jgi:hypothetical protein
MRKLRIFEHMSLDGVIQVSADENNFPYGDWTAPYRTPEGFAMITAMYGENFDLLLAAEPTMAFRLSGRRRRRVRWQNG